MLLGKLAVSNNQRVDVERVDKLLLSLYIADRLSTCQLVNSFTCLLVIYNSLFDLWVKLEAEVKSMSAF